MNKHLYRIVFNRALGVLQVVAEIAGRPGGGGSTDGGPVAATLRPVSFALWLALGLVGVVAPAAAQQVLGERVGRIVADPDAPGRHRPTVLETADGVPVVNITTPSAAGVSRNVYSQFDVNTEGAILNNSRTQVQTQLAGWVQGNPWLATGTARVILNEVNSADPSYLHGYVEVAGDRAQVVIANPAGIQVDGGGFLNASRATLTTGTPILEHDALKGYGVERGTIRVTGAGLDATHTDYTELIARSLKVNAGIWAQQLQVTTGINAVSTDHTQVAVATGTNTGAAPTLALDVSALGGMYAGKIALLGTEHGVGVRNAGEIGASAGELTVTVDGRLENTGAMQSKTDLRVSADGGLANAGTLSAAQELVVTTSQDLDNRGTVNARRIEVEAASLRNRDGAIEQTGTQQLTLQADRVSNRDGGRIGVMASDAPNPGGGEPGTGGGNAGGGTGGETGGGLDGDDSGTGGSVTPPATLADGVLNIAGTLDNDGGRINAGGGVDLLTANGLDNSGGYLGLQQLKLRQGDLGNAGGELTVSGDAQIHVDRITNDGGRMEVAGQLQVEAHTLSNRDGMLAHSGQAAAVRVVDAFDNTAGTFASNADRLTIDAGVLVNEAGRIEHAGSQGLELNAGTLAGVDGAVMTAGAAHMSVGQADHRGATLSATQVTLDAVAFDNRGGRIAASGTSASTLTASTLDNGDGGLIASQGDLHIQADTFSNAGGTVQHAGEGDLTVAAATLDGAGGAIASNGTLTLTGGHADLRGGTTSARQISVDTGSLTTADGTLIATGDGPLQLQIRDALDNDGGMVATNGALDLSAGTVRNRDGLIQAAGAGPTSVRVTGIFDGSGGTLATAGNTTVTAAELINAGGTMHAAGESTLQLTVEGLLDNSDDGLLAAGGDLSLTTGTLDNTAGRIEHAGEGELAIVADRLDGVDGSIVSNGLLRLGGETTNLRGGTTHAQAVAIDTGTLTTAGGSLIASGDGPLQLQVRDVLDNDRGVVATNGSLQLSAGAVSNREGTLQAAGGDPTRVQVAGTFDNTGGTLASAGDTAVSATAMLNAGGSVQAMDGSSLAITVDGLLDNSDDGLLASGGDMALTAGALDNTAGRIEHAGEGALDIDANRLDGTAGMIASNGALTLAGDVTDLRGGTTSAQSIVIGTGDLTTAGGLLIASGEGPLRLQILGVWDNDGGTAATNGALDLTAGTVSNRDGLIQAAGGDPTSLSIVGTFDNRGGTLAAAGDTTVVADEVRNAGGTLQVAADSTLQLSIDGLLDNSSEGLITAGGDLSLTADTLDNTSGRIEHAGEGRLTVDATTLEGVGGTIASNGALALSGKTTNLRGGTTHARSITIDTGSLTTADGTLIAGGDGPLRLQVRDALDNDRGTIATNGTLDLAAGSVTNRNGLVQSAGADPARVQVAGRFDNSTGTLATAGDLTLTADTLDNSAGRIEHAGNGTLALTVRTLDGVGGSVLSNGALELVGETLDLRGGETMATRITVDAGTLVTAGGALVASGADTLDLNVRDTFDNSAGTVAGNGGLVLAAGSTLNRDGLIQVAGSGPASMQVAGTFDNTGGTINTAGTTTLHAGELLNAGGRLQAASDNTLQITADGRLVNDGGVIEGNGDIALQARSFANRGGTAATGGAVDARVTGELDNSGGSLVAGEDLTIQAGTLLNRDTLDAGGQRGLFGAAITVDAATLDNTRGRIGAGEGLILAATDLTNAAGVIDASGNLTVAATRFDNAAGTLVQRGAGELVLDVAGTTSNTADGLIGAEGKATLQTGVLDNTGGTVFARGALDIASDGNVLNRGGLLQSNAGMAVSAGGTFDNSAGTLDATGAATVEAARIANVGGQLLAGELGDAGSALSLVSAGALDNRGGTVGSRGGDLFVGTGTVDNRSDGVLVAGRDLVLATGAVDNSAGTVYAARHLRYENSAGTLGNAGGQFGAGDTAWLDLARIDNTGDGRIQAGTLWLTAGQMANDGGEAGADILHAQIGTMIGDGRLYAAQWLDLAFSGDFTYRDGDQLESGDRLDLSVGGTFTNHGTLESAGSLNLAAGNVINTGTINASNDSGTGVNRISASGAIDNRAGARIEGDTVELSARDVTNTGDIVGDVVGILADTLTNGRDLGTALAARDYGEGFIGAADYLELRVGQRLSNRDGEIFSGGDLLIGGRTEGIRTALLENISGRIQSEGDLVVAADRIENVRRVLDYQQRALTPAEQAELTQVLGIGSGADTYGSAYQQLFEQYCREDMRSHCIHFDLAEYTERGTPSEGLFVTRASAGSVLASGGGMTLQATTLRNRHSAVAAGGTLVINGGGHTGGSGEFAPGVFNESLAGEQTWDVTADYWLLYQRCNIDLNCQYEPREMTGTFEYGPVTRMVHPEEGRATITAGGGMLIVSAGDVANTVVNVSDGLGGIGTGTVGGPGSTGLGVAGQASAGSVAAVGPATGGTVGDLQDAHAGAVTPGAAVGTFNGEQATAPAGALEAAAERINSTANPINAAPQLVGTPERPLPGLVPPDNGMFDRNADPDARFLVTTAPRFVPDDTIGSDYLAGRLGGITDLHKRLGDDHYEQRMVLEQILQLTGRRTLDGSDALTQYRTLMDNAAQTAAGLGLVLGTPLTAMQIASLDHDIVWLVEQVIDGQTVLVPVVYLSRATAGRLRADGALIAADDIDIRSTATVRNDGTMSATQGMWLSADTLINDGAITGTDRLAIATAGDTLNRGQLSGGAVDVAAGRDFVQTSTGSLASTGSTVVAAGRDLSLEATTVTAGEHLVLGAGRDLSVTAKAGVRTVADGYTVATRETLQASELQAGGNLVLQAGRDATLQAAQLQAGDVVAIAAGRDLTLSTLTTTDTSLTDINGRRFKQRTETLDEAVHGTTVQAGGDIVMTAGRDATLTAAQVRSEEGGIAIAAGRDLTLAAAEETHRFEQDAVRKKSGLFSSKTTTTHDESTATYAVGTTLSGETVDLVAGRDFIATAAQVVGTGDVTIAAARNVTIEAGQDTHTESHSSQRKKSGLFGNGGLSVTLGSQRSANTLEVTETSHTGSLVGSLEGDTRIVAGQDVTIRGSTVSSPEGDIAIHGRSVNIEEVHDTSTYRQTSRSKQQGLTLAVSVPVVEAALTAYDSSRSVGESNDSRVNAMAAANAGYDSYQAAGTAATAMNSGQAVSISLTVGSQQSSSEASGSSRDVVGSSINAGGRVDITATGAGDDSNIRISGSDVYGGTGASLHADGVIDILAAQNTYEQDSENHSSGWNAGLAATGGSGGWAAGITAGVNKGQGGSDGQTVTHTNAQVGSGGTTTLTSGGTTTIRGGQVTGERVEVSAEALAIESLQDTEHYKSRQEDGSVQVTVGWGASVSGSYSQSRVDADYASVSEQSGVLAGDGGYAVHVRGNTDLTGGIITSTDAAEAAGQNSVSTGTLTIGELENHARYKGTAFGLSGGVGKNGKGEQGQHQTAQGSGDGQAGGMSANKSFGFGRDEDSQSSTTSGGINTGNLTITDVAGQIATGRTVEEIKADVATTTTTDQLAENSGALVNRFDAAAVQKELDVQVQVTQAFDQNRQEAKAELYVHAQAKADEARAIRMANGGVDTHESTRLDEQAAGIKKTAKWLDVVAMGVYAGPDGSNLLTGETLTQIDLVRRAATPDSKIVVQTCEAYGPSAACRR